MGVGSILHDNGYSQYDKTRDGLPCKYCGKILASKATRTKHKQDQHGAEIDKRRY